MKKLKPSSSEETVRVISLAHSACLCHAEGYKMCRCYLLILTVPLETNYLRMYWTDLLQIFRTGIRIWVGMINPTCFSRSSKRHCYRGRA